MSDFLAGLVDRALDRANVVERRRPSRFEPPPNNLQLPTPWVASLWQHAKEEGIPGVEAEETRASPSLPIAAPRRRRVAAQAATVGERENVESARAAESPTPSGSGFEPVREPARRTYVPIAEKEPLRVALLAAPSRETGTVSKKEEKREVDNPGPALRFGRARQRDGVPDAGSPPHPTVQVLATPPKTNPEPASAPRPRTGEWQREPQRTQAATAKVLAPPLLMPIRPARPLRAPVTLAREASPGPPAIRVTIGRIEVRATSPTAPAGRAARIMAPKLSLQDYLRSRGGGAK